MSQTLRETFDTLSKYVIPKTTSETISQNLNPGLPLRPYQHEALRRFFFYLHQFQDRVRPTQLLFHMATGSGKTLIMAAIILHLYEQGYRHFLFFVNNTNIIDKTRENFLNPASAKYLFAEKIQLGSQQIPVREVDNFQSTHPDDISILFTTIQGLHTRLNTPRENSLTYEDFAEHNIVLISDEAHHLNALTKSQRDLNQDEMFELNTWEATVNRIFRARPDNLLLEFTATVELDHPAIKQKYEDKILYEYGLKQFRLDGYSKEVKVLPVDLPPLDRTLQAMILSQYRRKVAEKHGLPLKPVLLMKSRTIKESETHEAEFKTAIRELNAARLEKLRDAATSSIIQKAFAYFETQQITLSNLAAELRQEFDENRCLIVNSKSDSEQKQLLVNSLEDRDNEIRVIFAVDKLNEGWDVLNLFDIVRLYDTRDAKQGIPGKTTVSEAQLIGRGARYFPFSLEMAHIADQRKYDHDLDNELRVLEELYYHSAHNPKYINELTTALTQTGIMPQNIKTVTMRVKESFMATDFWKHGLIFVNKRVPNSREDILGFSHIIISQRHRYQLQTGFSQEALLLENQRAQGENSMTLAVHLRDFGEHVIRTALQRLTFFQFATLKTYFPHLTSIHEFITSDDYLGPIIVDITGVERQINALTPAQKLRITETVLEKIGQEIQTGTSDYIGTRKFEPLSIQYNLKDKTLQITVNEGGSQEQGIGMNETTNPLLRLNLQDKAWYVFDENYGTSEEKHFIRFLDGKIKELQNKYAELYLIRNERLFKIYRFSDGAAVEPDFVLFAVEKATQKPLIYQLFIEPKGNQLLDADRWKENFLKEIETQYELHELFENRDFRLVGMPFYNEDRQKMVFEDKLREVLL